MRLYLAVAVLMLAFVAYTEAQDQTVEKMTRITDQLSEIGRNLADNARTTFEKIQNSPFAQNAKTWLDEQIDKLKQKVGELSQ
ncbi:apolipoprotein C-I [Betta splendens]|uniref:Apolipoprotein C-I n=1 Tax=Betta splendens TaxID=158456 RepID=A0A8M1H5V2_BETSP|nr:apolipoprotein C-I [Betta splendens]